MLRYGYYACMIMNCFVHSGVFGVVSILHETCEDIKL